jgi:hypothetical protein
MNIISNSIEGLSQFIYLLTYSRLFMSFLFLTTNKNTVVHNFIRLLMKKRQILKLFLKSDLLRDNACGAEFALFTRHPNN